MKTLTEAVFDRVITKREAAERLSVCIKTLERHPDKFPPRVQISPRRVGYRESDIANFIAEAGKHMGNNDVSFRVVS